MLAAIFFFIGCEKSASQAPPLMPADQTYTVRARIVELPDDSTKTALLAHHEAIPSFIGKAGTVTGMKEMAMEFAWIAPGAAPTDLKVGDPIELTFEVRWKSEPRTQVTAIRRLPADTALNLKALSDPS